MSSPIRCRIGDVVRCGHVIPLGSSVDPMTIVRAVRDVEDSDARVAVAADPPGPVHAYVGCIHPGMGLRTRTALAVAARTQGMETPHDAALATARENLSSCSVGEGDESERGDESEGNTGSEIDSGSNADEGNEADSGSDMAAKRTQHRRVAARATGETEALRETVAAARGRLQERREHDLDTTQAAEELADAVARLSEAETDAVAAGQHLETDRERIREHRDSREERFRLEDQVANLERAARTHLREQVHEAYVAALGVVPGAGNIEDPFAVDPVTRALAVARIADLSAPVVLACERFENPDEAAGWLNAPVIWIPPATEGATACLSAYRRGP